MAAAAFAAVVTISIFTPFRFVGIRNARPVLGRAHLTGGRRLRPFCLALALCSGVTGIGGCVMLAHVSGGGGEPV